MASPLPSNRVKSKKLDLSSSNLPTDFSSGAASKYLTGCGSRSYRHLWITNTSAGRIAVVTTDSSASVPVLASNTDILYVEAGTVAVFDDIDVMDNVYICSTTGSAITSGIVVAQVWG